MMEFSKSQIAGLVLGYLKSEKCTSAHQEFLKTSLHLEEALQIIQKGKYFVTRIHGLSLEDILYEYAKIYTMVQGHLEASDYYEGNHRSDSLLEQLTYLLEKKDTEPITSSPFSTSQSGCSVDKEMNTDNCELNATPASSLPGNMGNDENFYRTPKRKEVFHRSCRNSENAPPSQPDENTAIVLRQTLLDHTELHEKIAETINIVRNTPEIKASTSHNDTHKDDASENPSKELDVTVRTVVQKTEEDPIFTRLINELIELGVGEEIPKKRHTNSEKFPEKSSQEFIQKEDISARETIDEANNDAVQSIMAACSSENPNTSIITGGNTNVNKTSNPNQSENSHSKLAKSSVVNNSEVIVFNGSLDNYIKSASTVASVPPPNPIYLNTGGLYVMPSATTTSSAGPQQIYLLNSQPILSVQPVSAQPILTEKDIMAMPTVIVSEDLGSSVVLPPAKRMDKKTKRRKGLAKIIPQAAKSENEYITLYNETGMAEINTAADSIKQSNIVITKPIDISSSSDKIKAITVEKDSVPNKHPCVNDFTTKLTGEMFQVMVKPQISVETKMLENTALVSHLNNLSLKMNPAHNFSDLTNKADTSKSSRIEYLVPTTKCLENLHNNVNNITICSGSESHSLTTKIPTNCNELVNANSNAVQLLCSEIAPCATNNGKLKLANPVTVTEVPDGDKLVHEQKRLLVTKQDDHSTDVTDDLSHISGGKRIENVELTKTPLVNQTLKNKIPKSGSHVRTLDFSSPPKLSTKGLTDELKTGKLGDSDSNNKAPTKDLFNKVDPKKRQKSSNTERLKSWDTDLRALASAAVENKNQGSKMELRKSTKERRKAEKKKDIDLSAEARMLEEALKTPVKQEDKLEQIDKIIAEDTIGSKHIPITGKFGQIEELCEGNHPPLLIDNDVKVKYSLRNCNSGPSFKKKCNINTTNPTNRKGKLQSVKSSKGNVDNDNMNKPLLLSPTKLNASKRNIVKSDRYEDIHSNDDFTEAMEFSNEARERTPSPLLETPVKYMIPKTPCIHSNLNSITPFSKVLEEQLKGVDLTALPTPKLPLTPCFPLTPSIDLLSSAYSNRPTDYSNSSSYYQPSDPEQNKSLEQMLIEESERLSQPDKYKKPPVKILSNVVIEQKDEIHDNESITTGRLLQEHLKTFNQNVIGRKNLNLVTTNVEVTSSENSSCESSESSSSDTDDTWCEGNASDNKPDEKLSCVYSLRTRSTMERNKLPIEEKKTNETKKPAYENRRPYLETKDDKLVENSETNETKTGEITLGKDLVKEEIMHSYNKKNSQTEMAEILKRTIEKVKESESTSVKKISVNKTSKRKAIKTLKSNKAKQPKKSESQNLVPNRLVSPEKSRRMSSNKSLTDKKAPNKSSKKTDLLNTETENTDEDFALHLSSDDESDTLQLSKGIETQLVAHSNSLPVLSIPETVPFNKKDKDSSTKLNKSIENVVEKLRKSSDKIEIHEKVTAVGEMVTADPNAEKMVSELKERGIHLMLNKTPNKTLKEVRNAAEENQQTQVTDFSNIDIFNPEELVDCIKFEQISKSVETRQAESENVKECADVKEKSTHFSGIGKTTNTKDETRLSEYDNFGKSKDPKKRFMELEASVVSIKAKKMSDATNEIEQKSFETKNSKRINKVIKDCHTSKSTKSLNGGMKQTETYSSRTSSHRKDEIKQRDSTISKISKYAKGEFQTHDNKNNDMKKCVTSEIKKCETNSKVAKNVKNKLKISHADDGKIRKHANGEKTQSQVDSEKDKSSCNSVKQSEVTNNETKHFKSRHCNQKKSAKNVPNSKEHLKVEQTNNESITCSTADEKCDSPLIEGNSDSGGICAVNISMKSISHPEHVEKSKIVDITNPRNVFPPENDSLKQLCNLEDSFNTSIDIAFDDYICVEENLQCIYKETEPHKSLEDYNFKLIDKCVSANVYLEELDQEMVRKIYCTPFKCLLEIPSKETPVSQNKSMVDSVTELISVNNATYKSESTGIDMEVTEVEHELSTTEMVAKEEVSQTTNNMQSKNTVASSQATRDDLDVSEQLDDDLMNYAVVGSIREESPDIREIISPKTGRKRKALNEEEKHPEKKLKPEKCEELLKKIDVDSFLNKVHGSDKLT